MAVKKIRLTASDGMKLRSKSELFMKCTSSSCIVRCLGGIQHEDVYWVCLNGTDDGVDYYGVLSLWITSNIYKKRKSVK